MRRHRALEIIGIAAIVISAIELLVITADFADDCDRRGGVPVMGIYRLRCVNEAPK